MTLTRTSDQPRQRRKRRCAVCRDHFEPRSISHRACKPECAQVLAAAKRQKDERKADRERKQKLKTRGDWLKEAQVAFNAFIRERDRLAGYACISSGKPLDWSGNNVDAGHYRSRGSAPHLRFDERNVHAQSKQENRYASGNATDYRIGLIARIGQAAVEALEVDQESRDHSIPALRQIIATYKAKLAELRKEAA
jgi:hypothetical protein